MFLKQVKQLTREALNLRQSIAKKKDEMKRELQKLEAERRTIGEENLCKDDQIISWDEEVKKWEAALRENIRNHLVTERQIPAAHPVWLAPKNLVRFLVPWRGRKEGPTTELILAAGNWENLKRIALEELNKVDPLKFGHTTNAERRRKVDNVQRRIDEIKAALAELDQNP